MKAWYLIHSKPRQEHIAKEQLERQGYQTYLPYPGLTPSLSLTEPAPYLIRGIVRDPFLKNSLQKN